MIIDQWDGRTLTEQEWDTVVIGGGIAGLVASIYLARAGQSVLLVEKSARLGGRGSTEVKAECYFNMGAHALYQNGMGMRILKELEINPEGGSPNLNGLLVQENKLFRMPSNPVHLLTHSLFSWKAKRELLSFFLKLKKIDSMKLQHVSYQSWLEEQIESNELRDFLLALGRLTTYSHHADLISAGAVLGQLKLGSVLYVHHGWQTVIDELQKKALAAGVTIWTNKSIEALYGEFPHIQINIKGEENITCRNVLVTAGPKETLKLFQQHPKRDQLLFLQNLRPIKAACLDIALRELPSPNTSFALALDQPLYFSNHSKAAQLSKEPHESVVHLIKYMRNDIDEEERHEDNLRKTELELYQWMSLLQPGWEKYVVTKRFLPSMKVTHGLPLASEDGLLGRPKVNVQEIPGVYLAGDWVGETGMLADASFSSAREAANKIVEVIRREGEEGGIIPSISYV